VFNGKHSWKSRPTIAILCAMWYRWPINYIGLSSRPISLYIKGNSDSCKPVTGLAPKLITLASAPVVNNDSSEVAGIINPGPRVQLKGHRQKNVNNF